ncbi:MAG: hypothetical protein DRJ05_09175 [Bacteroidetes bacterium]|nr:MAG: hypothetical protein DRJ05_09175 [Bacteroidota bacterium]
MNSDRKNIDKLFESTLKGYREKPSPNAWNRMSRELDGAKSTKVIVLLKWMAAAVLILFAFGSGYFYAVYNSTDEAIALKEIPANETTLNPEAFDNIPSIAVEEPDENLITIHKNDMQLDEKPDIAQKLSPVNDNVNSDLGTFPVNAEQGSLSTSNEETEANVMASTSIPAVVDSVKSTEIIPVQNSEIVLAEPIEIIQIDEDKLKTGELVHGDFFDKSGIPGGFGEKKIKDTKWGIGARVASIQSYREISFTSDENFSQGVVAESNYNDREDKLNSYAGGVDVRYQINSKWSLQSGVYLSRIGQVNNDPLAFKQGDDNYMLFKVTTSTGEIDIVYEKVPEDIKSFSDSKDTSELKTSKNIRLEQTFDLFEVPFLVGYKIGNRKFTLNLSGGFSPAYVVSNSSTLIADEQKHDIGSSTNINSVIVNSSFSLGIQYAFTKKLALNFEPTFKYSINPINNNNQFNYHPYSLTWFTGVRFSF